MTSERWRERGMGVAVAALTTLALLLALELGVRALGVAPERFANTARVVSPRKDVLLDGYPSNPRGYFDLDLRDAATRERFRSLAPRRIDKIAQRSPWVVECRYNSHRFRGPEPGPKQAGRARVVVVGDSFTEGQGVKEPDTSPRQLALLLEAAAPGRFEVHNAGRRAHDLPELLTVFTDALALEPDVVVYAMVLNDGARSPAFQARQTYVNDWILDRRRVQEDADAAPPPSPLEPRLWTLARDAWEGFRISRETARWYRDMYGEANADGWRETREAIARMDRETRARGGRFVVALWPLLVGLDGRYPFAEQHAAIGAYCAQAGIEFVDLLPALQGRRPADLFVHPVDMHPNEVAQALVADAIAPRLLR
ncbi:MAG: SGNH/GDSL hydrolase family protein [Vicinamibacteria bacterium]|nr:SGNH/GDSL hydrolase family protein [Vicinamibacteria bacterium]